eukprot:TRINITY_DN3907_c0_g1_i4.p1 TRINITY_DN3907_c0_g1~~TRINITY_DN3907_c0_g1_i4.p1  ORF type:complete len:164 (+),score=46.74 TRINITY_DN3907_c0_g1_i4:928-1419(+)
MKFKVDLSAKFVGTAHTKFLLPGIDKIDTIGNLKELIEEMVHKLYGKRIRSVKFTTEDGYDVWDDYEVGEVLTDGETLKVYDFKVTQSKRPHTEVKDEKEEVETPSKQQKKEVEEVKEEKEKKPKKAAAKKAGRKKVDHSDDTSKTPKTKTPKKNEHQSDDDK